MQMFKLRSRLARAATIGVVAAAASLTLGTAAASAATPDPSLGVPPHFYNGAVSGIRNSGSDTTFFMMQRIGDLYTGAGLYGCILNQGAGVTLFNTGAGFVDDSGHQQDYCVANGNIATTDVNDNWDRTEVTEGVDDVGSGAGQSQLCGSINSPIAVDFSRSSKPAGTTCDLVQTGYAKDGVPVVDYPLNPSTYGTAAAGSPYASISGGVWGPVPNGWLPGDPVNGPFTGTKLNTINNNDGTGTTTTTAYRIWCASGGNQITDWGALTNLGGSGKQLQVPGVQTTGSSATITLASGTWPTTVVNGDAITGTGIPAGDTISGTPSGNTATLATAATATGTTTAEVTTASALAVGSGVPVGIKLRVQGVNTSSGTESTFTSFANSGFTGTGNCVGSKANMDANAANDPAVSGSPQEIALENNSAQVAQFAASDFPGDFGSQAIEVDTTLYIESNGVNKTDPYAAAVTINGVTTSNNEVNMNGGSDTTAAVLSNSYATARTLFNIYRSAEVRASVAGFINWLCDGNTNFTKGLDNSSGKNFDTELSTIISGNFGFPRLTDTSAAPVTAIPADGVAAPNTSCAATLTGSTTSGVNTLTLASGTFANDIPNGTAITDPDFTAGTTVTGGQGTNTLMLSNTANNTDATSSMTFSGVPAVQTVGSPNS